MVISFGLPGRENGDRLSSKDLALDAILSRAPTMKPRNLFVKPEARILSDRPHGPAKQRRRKILDVKGMLCGL